MLFAAGFFLVLSYLVAGTKRRQKSNLVEEVNKIHKDFNQVHNQHVEVLSQIAAINEVNKTTVTDSMQKTLLEKIESISEEIKALELHYKKLKGPYDKKKNEEEEEERKKRRRQAAASGGFYGGYSSSSRSSSSSSSSGFGSWGGGGGGFSGGGASGGW